MAKSKSLFFCKNCGYQSSQWLGKCPSCGEWSSFVEEVVDRGEGQKGKSHLAKTIQNTPKRLDEISLDISLLATYERHWDRYERIS